jgi:two-component system, cell cycle response regulator
MVKTKGEFATQQEEIEALRAALRAAEMELQRSREEAEHRGNLLDILHEVMGNLSTDEIFHMLARRLARALNLSHASVVLAKAGDEKGVVATAFEHPALENLEIEISRYPEVAAALEQKRAVLIEDLHTHPWYAKLRDIWARDGIQVTVRSVMAIPFTLERNLTGVFLLRRTDDKPRFDAAAVEFAETVIKSAVSAVQRAHLLETTRADNARLEVLAQTDPLTELLNRRALAVRLAIEMERVRRYSSPLTLLMIDLDHFKKVNDTYGHLVGDDVLQQVALLLRRAVRSVDVVARYGGEEFVVALPETAEVGAVAFADRIRQKIESHPFPGGGPIPPPRLTASIGVATYPAAHVETVEDLFACADAALYRAKQKGRNRVCT